MFGFPLKHVTFRRGLGTGIFAGLSCIGMALWPALAAEIARERAAPPNVSSDAKAPLGVQAPMPQAGGHSIEPQTSVGDAGSGAPKTCGEIRDPDVAAAMGCIQQSQREIRDPVANNSGAPQYPGAAVSCLLSQLNHDQVTVELSLRSPEFAPPADAEKRTYRAEEGSFGSGANPKPEARTNCSDARLNREQVTVPLSLRSPQLAPPAEAEKRTYPAVEGTFGRGGPSASSPAR